MPRNRPKPAIYKRSDDPAQVASAIKYYEKQPQTRPVRRRLVKLRERFAKLTSPFLGENPIVTQPGENLIEKVEAARQVQP